MKRLLRCSIDSQQNYIHFSVSLTFSSVSLMMQNKRLNRWRSYAFISIFSYPHHIPLYAEPQNTETINPLPLNKSTRPHFIYYILHHQANCYSSQPGSLRFIIYSIFTSNFPSNCHHCMPYCHIIYSIYHASISPRSLIAYEPQCIMCCDRHQCQKQIHSANTKSYTSSCTAASS